MSDQSQDGDGHSDAEKASSSAQIPTWIVRRQFEAAQRLLTTARGLIDSPSTWTQGGLARDAAGREVLPDDKRAVSFCASGAIYRAAALDGGVENSPRIGNCRLIPLGPSMLAGLTVMVTLHADVGTFDALGSTPEEQWAALLDEFFGGDEIPDALMHRYLTDVFDDTMAEVEALNDRAATTHQNILEGFDRALEVLSNHLGGQQ